MLLFTALLAVHIPFARNHYWAYEQTEEFVVLQLPLCVFIILFVDTRERRLLDK